MPLDPELARLAAAAGRPRIPLRQPRISTRRRDAVTAAERSWEQAGLPIPDVHIEKVRVRVTGFPDVTIRIHRPHGAQEPLPAVLTFFGGAFRQGSNDYPSNRWMHARRAIDAHVAVVAVDYAQAPEHRFPTQIEQGLAALDWLVTSGRDHGIDPGRIAVGGQSSGGNIAAAIAQWNLERAAHPLRLQLLEVPGLDLTGDHADRQVLREMHIPTFLLRRDRRSIARDYLPRGITASDPRVSPLLREDLRGLPPAVLLAAEYDPLRGDTATYHARLREAGVPSSATISLGTGHDSAGLPGLLSSARLWHGTVVGALRELHGEMS
ncbi:alpha/beta hydrolase [Brachybacterium endophyticum]|uniref:Alpha/beta hydrolase n=1 Tax=Brachybacterium endophyticum TaxID=2182385 RepID=A0A2U2RN44_9MICO|nr:alpha/beta hydrolase [Brachybacterium endophyticum]PWH07288.1 alpha/beta hydrolase [Brachybacterium endophyticum]